MPTASGIANADGINTFIATHPYAVIHSIVEDGAAGFVIFYSTRHNPSGVMQDRVSTERTVNQWGS